MFKEARIKLTVWYLAIIMGVSLSFSGVIYLGVNRELSRIANFQRTRIQGIVRGFPVPMEVSSSPDMNAIDDARARIIFTLGLINISIFIFSGLGGYFLAGQTLDPIAEMLKKQKEFVSNASHELRTPLTSLTTEIEVALRDKNISLSDAKKLLVSNLEEVKKMNDLSNYLLKLNKFQDGKNSAKFKKVDLKIIVENVITKLKPIARLKNINIVLKLSKCVINGEEEALSELVTILTENAIKYSQKSKNVEIVIKNKTLIVKDNGVGISSVDLPHIFERFYRAESSRNKDKSEGYGLGLAIAKTITDLHGATIKVSSKIDKGTTFSVIF